MVDRVIQVTEGATGTFSCAQHRPHLSSVHVPFHGSHPGVVHGIFVALAGNAPTW